MESPYSSFLRVPASQSAATKKRAKRANGLRRKKERDAGVVKGKGEEVMKKVHGWSMRESVEGGGVWGRFSSPGARGTSGGGVRACVLMFK